MSIDKVWVLAESAEGKPTTTTLELLTQARSMGAATEAVAWGADTAAVAGELGNYGATTVHDVGDLADALPGAPVAAAIASLVTSPPLAGSSRSSSSSTKGAPVCFSQRLRKTAQCASVTSR